MTNSERPPSRDKPKDTPKRSLPLNAKKIFGPINIRKLNDLLDNPLFDEADKLAEDGSIPMEEVEGYLMASEETQRFFNEIHELGRQFAGSQNMERLLKETARTMRTGETRIGLFGCALDFTAITNCLGNDKTASFRNGKLHVFLNAFFEHICLKAQRQCEKGVKGMGKEECRRALWMFLNLSNAFYRQKYNIDFTGRILLDFQRNLENAVNGYPEQWRDLCKADAKEDIKSISEENAMKLDYVRDLSEFRKIPTAALQDGPVTIATRADELKAFESLKIGVISYVRIKLSTELRFGEIIEYEDTLGNDALHFPFNDGVIDLCLDRCGGDLTFALGRMPLYHFLKRSDYEILKRKILDYLIELLEEKQPEPGPEPKAEVIEETRESIAENLYAEPVITEEAEKELLPVPEETVAVDTVRMLRSFGPRDVYAKLVRLLGKEVRVTGSHFIFKCRERGTYPIALHFGERRVGLGLLKKCLNRFGIGIKEFCMA